MKGNLRKENNCLNCGAKVTGRFCSECGQENRKPREGFGELLYHFFSDFTHFDSKVFITLKDLILRPGFLTKEYLAGKRVSYLHPIRMYLLISFIFFLFMGFMKKSDSSGVSLNVSDGRKEITEGIHSTIDSLKAATPGSDTSIIGHTAQKMNSVVDDFDDFDFKKYNSIEEFDSVQKKIPADKRMHGVKRLIFRKTIAWKEKYGPLTVEMANEKIFHAIPKAMFFLLPLFALFLQWFYKKEHYYVDHAIFSLHFHTLIFLALLFFLILDRLFRVSYFQDFSILLLFIYLIIALRNTYHQSWWSSFIKGTTVSLLYLVSVIIVLVLAVFIIFITI